MGLDAEGTAVETAMHKRRDWKGYAAMVGAIAALVTAWFHRQPEDAAKASYLETSEAILDCQRASIKNHEDLTALHEYIDSYVKEHTVIEVPVPTGEAVPQTPAPLSPPKPPKVVHVVAPASAAPPPSIAPLMEQRAPRSVDKISW
jgi:hypothetical protein